MKNKTKTSSNPLLVLNKYTKKLDQFKKEFNEFQGERDTIKMALFKYLISPIRYHAIYGNHTFSFTLSTQLNPFE